MRRSIAVFLVVVPALALGGCGASSDVFTSDLRLFPNAREAFSSRDWSAAPSAAEISLARKVTPEDYVDANGACAVAAPAETAPPDGNTSGSPLQSGVQLGIGLGMTECQVVQRAGQPSTTDIGAENNARKVVLTYTGGNWPGIYTFVEGRLKVIDQIAVPEQPKPASRKRPAKPKTATRS